MCVARTHAHTNSHTKVCTTHFICVTCVCVTHRSLKDTALCDTALYTHDGFMTLL